MTRRVMLRTECTIDDRTSHHIVQHRICTTLIVVECDYAQKNIIKTLLQRQNPNIRKVATRKYQLLTSEICYHHFFLWGKYPHIRQSKL
jgi:hypothetical protein